jgi:hypothetical protein
MHVVKAFGLTARLVNHFHGADAKPARNYPINYFACVARLHGVGLDDCER